jgi:hypothetical protein
MEGPASEALHAPTRAIVAGVLLGGGDEDFCTDADQVGPFPRCERH